MEMTDKKKSSISRDEIAKRLHVIEIDQRLHVLEIPDPEEMPCKVWSEGYRTKEAAEMFSECLLNEYEKGTPECAICPSEVIEQAVDVRKFLEQWSDTSDLGGLAVALCQERPWNDSEFPF